MRRPRPALLLSAALAPLVNAAQMTIDQGVTPGSFVYQGSTGASAQQMYLGSASTVYIVDKTQRNDNFTVNGHPAWAAELDLIDKSLRPLDIVTNSFCAGGGVIANGTLVNVGGNQAIGPAGDQTGDGTGVTTASPYGDLSGSKIMRVMTPCENDQCNWAEWDSLVVQRWYPTLETLSNGTVLIVGGELFGGYVNSANQLQNNPTVQVWPGNGLGNVAMPFLNRTQPLNLYALVWQLPSGQLFVNAGRDCILYDPATLIETTLPNMPVANRVYPSNAAVAMLPLTPANNYTATLLFCGGNEKDNTDADYDPTKVDVSAYPGSKSCQQITPTATGAGSAFVTDDDLPEGRVMGQFIILPDGTLWMGNGAASGTAGYGLQNYTNSQSYAKDPIYAPAIYNPLAPAGSRWSRQGLGSSTIARMYHSSAMLLPDGSVMVAGSSPSADFTGVVGGVSVNATFPQIFWTTYAWEKFYPAYYAKPRPQPTGVPSSIAYGGDYFNVSLPAGTVSSAADLNSTKAVVIRTGFSTHSVNFGMRSIELETTVSANKDGSATLHVNSIPSPNHFPPAPALFFIVINGVPSIGQFITVGNGQVGAQPVAALATLPPSSGIVGDPLSGDGTNNGGSNGGNGNGGGKGKNAATQISTAPITALVACFTLAYVAFA